MTLFATVEMAGKSGGGVSKREAVGNGPVTVCVGRSDHALRITVQPSGDYSIETIRSDGSRGWLSFFAKLSDGSKRTVRFRRRKVTGTLDDERSLPSVRRR